MSGRQQKLTDAELALAYELRVDGVPWKYIAIGLSIDANALESALRRRLK